MTKRLLITGVLLLLGAGYIAHASESERVTLRAPLAGLPMLIDGWTGREAAPFAPDIVKVLGVNEYVNRFYLTGQEPWVSLYVGYYESQRQGDTMHSPLNCLPGAGWEPVEKGRTQVLVRDRSGAEQRVEVNQFVIQKGLDKQLVLYWYQSHGRVIASEYTSKIFMVYDAMRTNRTDGAMVRVITPLDNTDVGRAAAAARASRFVGALFPSLSELLPS